MLIRMGHIYFPPVNVWKVTRPLPRPLVTGVPGVSLPVPGNFPHRGPQPVTQSGLTPLHICPSRHDDSGPCPKSGRERTSVDPCPSGVTQSEVTTFCSLRSGGTRTPYGAGYERGASLSLFASGPRGLSGGHGSGQRKNGPWHDGAIEPLASFGGKNDQGFHGLKQDVSLKRGEVAVTGCGLGGGAAGGSQLCCVSAGSTSPSWL